MDDVRIFEFYLCTRSKVSVVDAYFGHYAGKPAPNVKISLSKQNKNGNWSIIDEKSTDVNGRIPDFLKVKKGLNYQGIYKLTFHTQPYFKKINQESFYPFIEVVFELKDSNHYHVPITLSPFGYSTYRGN